MTRRDLMHKWLIYTLGLVPIWLLDAYILPRFPLFDTTPILLPVAVVAVERGASPLQFPQLHVSASSLQARKRNH